MWFMAAAMLVVPFAAAEIAPDATREAVIERLGAPTGAIVAGDREILYFPRGTVRLNGDRVTDVDLLSEAELLAHRAAAQERRERLAARGWEIYERKRVDPAFAALSADEQLTFWRRFAARYPMIPVDPEIRAARTRLDEQEKFRRAEARLTELERRVGITEAPAVPVYRPLGLVRGFPKPGFHHRLGPVHSRGYHSFRAFEEPSLPKPDDSLRARATREFEESRRETLRRAWERRGPMALHRDRDGK